MRARALGNRSGSWDEWGRRPLLTHGLEDQGLNDLPAPGTRDPDSHRLRRRRVRTGLHGGQRPQLLRQMPDVDGTGVERVELLDHREEVVQRSDGRERIPATEGAPRHPQGHRGNHDVDGDSALEELSSATPVPAGCGSRRPRQPEIVLKDHRHITSALARHSALRPRCATRRSLLSRRHGTEAALLMDPPAVVLAPPLLAATVAVHPAPPHRASRRYSQRGRPDDNLPASRGLDPVGPSASGDGSLGPALCPGTCGQPPGPVPARPAAGNPGGSSDGPGSPRHRDETAFRTRSTRSRRGRPSPPLPYRRQDESGQPAPRRRSSERRARQSFRLYDVDSPAAPPRAAGHLRPTCRRAYPPRTPPPRRLRRRGRCWTLTTNSAGFPEIQGLDLLIWRPLRAGRGGRKEAP